MDFKRFFVNNVSGEESSNPLQNGVRKFSFRELRAATDNFNVKNVIGKGGFGVVYKGCLADGSTVAIKRVLNGSSKPEGILQFKREVEMISMALHKNLLKLQGFCITSKEWLLVYPFMANGSVASQLKGRQESQSPLDWKTRKRVAYGTAMALAYLHESCNPKIIHRDVKSDNILLDEDFEAVVGDFGLAKLIGYEETHATTIVCGTIGHIAPEYFQNLRCSEKTDVYGYGILLLELVTGKMVYDIVPSSKRDEVLLFDWIEGILTEKNFDLLIDSHLHLSFRNHNLYPEVEDMIHIALQCTQRSPKERPKMSNVVRMLDDHGLVGVSVINSWVFDDRLKELDKQEIFHEALSGKGSLKKVYKATLDDGHIIAIKRLTKDKINRANNNFEHYLDLMGNAKHPYILAFGAYYKFGKEEFLVYDYLPNGSMYSYSADPLRGPKGIPLDWLGRLRSLKQVARGLCDIHEKLNAVHGNIKSSNILFDLDYVAHIQLEIPDDVFRVSSVYTAPEQSLSQEADVYSFGVLFLEYLTAVVPSQIHSSFYPCLKDEEWAVYFPEWVGSKFSYPKFSVYNPSFYAALEVGLGCVIRSPQNRPTMIKVIEDIEDVERKILSEDSLSSKSLSFSSKSFLVRADYEINL